MGVPFVENGGIVVEIIQFKLSKTYFLCYFANCISVCSSDSVECSSAIFRRVPTVVKIRAQRQSRTQFSSSRRRGPVSSLLIAFGVPRTTKAEAVSKPLTPIYFKNIKKHHSLLKKGRK